jgi:hypothetical protein
LIAFAKIITEIVNTKVGGFGNAVLQSVDATTGRTLSSVASSRRVIANNLLKRAGASLSITAVDIAEIGCGTRIGALAHTSIDIADSILEARIIAVLNQLAAARVGGIGDNLLAAGLVGESVGAVDRGEHATIDGIAGLSNMALIRLLGFAVGRNLFGAGGSIGLEIDGTGGAHALVALAVGVTAFDAGVGNDNTALLAVDDTAAGLLAVEFGSGALDRIVDASSGCAAFSDPAIVVVFGAGDGSMDAFAVLRVARIGRAVVVVVTNGLRLNANVALAGVALALVGGFNTALGLNPDTVSSTDDLSAGLLGE